LDDGFDDFEEGEEASATPKRPGFPIEPRRLWRIVVEYRKQLVVAFATAAMVALLASFFVPRAYESFAQLFYEGTPVLDRQGGAPSPEAFVESATAPSRLREVRDRLGWDVSIEELAQSVDAFLEADSSMVIVVQAANAEAAHGLAQAALDVFLAEQASFNAKRVEQLTVENRGALERAKERRERAVAEYETFRRQSGKSDLLLEQEELLRRAADLRAAADEAAVEVASQQARIGELEKAQKELPRQIVASAKKGSPIDTPLAQARSELAAARASLSEQHPRVQALKERVASLQAQRKGEKSELADQTLVSNPARASVDEQVATSRAALAAARERELALRALLAGIKAEAEALAPDQAEAHRILGELDGVEERVQELTERAATLQDAALTPMTGFRLVSAPMVPEDSQASAKYVVPLVLLPFLTVFIVTLVLIGRRLRDLTTVAPREVAWWGNGPVLGTTIWPRDPAALEPFVDELEDLGVYGAGRTLVVPATEGERELACSFAMRLAEAPWLAAAILDVGERVEQSYESTLVTPPPAAAPPRRAPRRLSSQATPAVNPDRAAPASPLSSDPNAIPLVTPAPPHGTQTASSSRPPRKKTMIGLPAVQSSTPPGSVQLASEPPAPGPASKPPERSKRSSASGPEPFRRLRGPRRATVRMVVPVSQGRTPSTASAARSTDAEEEAFLLTRPVPVATDQPPPRAGGAPPVDGDERHTTASHAVMHAAVRLLGDGDDEVTGLRRSNPPREARAQGDVTGVALAWNGPLSGPVLRRAARLAHRVIVVVSSGISVVELSRIPTRLGRSAGLGYVLVDIDDAYVDLPDRVGPVEEFWGGYLGTGVGEPKLP